jgi:predicted DCC family thiol-disulfide oxidoreductase YuxK
VTGLTVFYDARCGLCCAVRNWLARQPQLMPLECRPKSGRGERAQRVEPPRAGVPASAGREDCARPATARARRSALGTSARDGGGPREQGEIDHTDNDDLVVVADSGEVWAGDSAWLMVLWALADYRHWSYRLASPLLLPTARTLFAKLSDYRGSLSCGLGLQPDEQ